MPHHRAPSTRPVHPSLAFAPATPRHSPPPLPRPARGPPHTALCLCQAKHANYRASAAGAANAARRAEVGKAEQARVDGERAASERAAAEAAARALLVTPQRDGDDSPPASSVGLATEASSCALVLLSLFESAIPPGAVAASVPTASAAYPAYADVPVWLVLQQWPDRSPQVRSSCSTTLSPTLTPTLTLAQEP